MKAACITLLDEVNCRITGLDANTNRACIKALKFDIPGAKFMPSVRLGRWDGTASFYTAGGACLINLLPRILPLIMAAGYEIQTIDNRQAWLLPSMTCDDQVLADQCWPHNHPTHAGQPIVLRHDQVAIVQGFLSHAHGIQVAATSAGKTITCAALCRSMQHLGRSMIIVPSKDLVEQTAATFAAAGLDVGTYYGKHKQWACQHTICTWQSLDVLYKASLQGDAGLATLLDGMVAVIADECHTAKAEVLRTLMTRAFAHIPLRWGLTGTMPREDHLAVSIVGSIGPVIGNITASDLQDAGIISNCEINIIQIQDRVKFSNYRAEYQYLTQNTQRLELLAQMVRNIAATGNCLVLVQNLATGQGISDLIEDCVFISGKDSSADRQKQYQEIEASDCKPVIATFGIASTGISVARIKNLVIIEAGKSFTKVIQSIGRGLRRAHDKDMVQVFDICSTCKYSKRHLAERKQFYLQANYPHQVMKYEV